MRLQMPGGRIPATLLLASLALTGCQRSALPPGTISFQSQPALRHEAPELRTNAPERSERPTPPAAGQSALESAKAIALQGGLITDLPAMASQLDTQAYQVQVVPRNSQEKADRIAREWASDARQLYVIWAYWKLPILSITRHAYYSPSKGKALKVEFTLASFFPKSLEESADSFEQASLILNEARDRHAFGASEAHAIAKRMGYHSSKYGAAVLLDIKAYGPMWVFADMSSQTQGTPVMLVNAQSGMVTQSGEAMMLAEYLFQRAGY